MIKAILSEKEFDPEQQTMRQKLYDLLVAISWADLSRTYFGKSSSWLYH